MRLLWLTAIAAIGSAASIAPAFAGVTFGGDGAGVFIGASVYGAAVASDGRSPVYFSDSHDPSSLVLPSTSLSTIATGSATDTNGPLLASASGTTNTTVTFNSAAAGLVEFSGTNSAASNSDSGGARASGGSSFEYYFSSTASQPIMIGYNLSSSMLGCCGNTISVADLTENFDYVLFKTIYNSDNQGELTGNLNAGDVYKLTISKSEYLGVDAPQVIGVGASTIPYDDRFSFTIGAVSAAPEPATWALMIIGAGMIGAGLRSARRRTAAFA